MGTFIFRASLLDLPIVLRTHIQFLFPESALLDWWLSDIPSARSGVAGRYRAAGPSLLGPLWETFLVTTLCVGTRSQGHQNSWLRPECSILGCYDWSRTYVPVCHPGSLDGLPWHPIHTAFHPLTPYQHCLMHV